MLLIQTNKSSQKHYRLNGINCLARKCLSNKVNNWFMYIRRPTITKNLYKLTDELKNNSIRIKFYRFLNGTDIELVSIYKGRERYHVFNLRDIGYLSNLIYQIKY